MILSGKIRSLIYLIFLIMFFRPIKISAEITSLSINQTTRFNDEYNISFSIRSPFLNGTAIIESPANLPSISPELTSYGISLSITPFVTFFSGSITTSGLPSRAKNPVPSLYSPFYSPLSVSNKKILHYGNTLDIENVAVEISLKDFRFITFSSLSQKSGDASWVFFSHTKEAFTPNDISLSVSLLVGTYRLLPETNTSWFLPRIYIPETRIFIPGIELILKQNNLSASCTGFMSIGHFQKPSFSVRSDISMKFEYIQISGGFYTADRSFIDMQGNSNSILNRIFLAPSINLYSPAFHKTELQIGGILFVDTLKNESFYKADLEKISTRIGLSLNNQSLRFQLKMMKDSEAVTLSASSLFKQCIFHSLQLELKAKTSLADHMDLPYQPINTELLTHLIFKPFQFMTIGAGLVCMQDYPESTPEYQENISVSICRQGRHSDCNIASTLSFKNNMTEAEGNVSVKIVLR